jgi:hypothetical protein
MIPVAANFGLALQNEEFVLDEKLIKNLHGNPFGMDTA